MSAAGRRSLVRGGVFALLVGFLPIAAPSLASASLPLPVHAGATLSTPTAVSPGKQTTVLSSSFTTTEATNIRATGWISITNDGRKPAVVTVRWTMLEAGVPEVVGSDEVITVPSRSTVSIPTGVQCDAEPTGSYTVELDLVATAGVVIDNGAQSILALPTSYAGYLPTADVNGDGQVALGASPATVLSTTMSFGDGSAVNALGEGWVVVRNGGKKAALVTLDYTMDGVNMGSVTSIIGPDRALAIPVGVQCDGITAGNHVFKVAARSAAAGTTFQAGFLSVVGLPTDGSIPNNHVNGDGKALSIGTKPTRLLSVPLTTQVQSDVWMGGWVTLDNPTAKPVTVTLQAAMGDGAEGPPVIATIPARGSISLPFGVQCDGEPAGATTLDVYATTAGGGPQWNGDGMIAGWAIGAP